MFKKAKANPATIDAYLAAVPDEQRAALQKLRKDILSAAPAAEECISYGLAAFKLDGRLLVGFGTAARHCGFYLMSSSIVKTHSELLAKYDTGKGTIRFAPDKPLPKTLITKLVRARIAENAARSKRSR